MKKVFVKKYWKEENILFYIQFEDNIAIRQLEIRSTDKVYLTIRCPQQGNSMLYDQTLDELELEGTDFITEAEFNLAWDDKINFHL